MLHCFFFQFPSKVEDLYCFHFLSVSFCGQSGQQNRRFWKFFLFFFFFFFFLLITMRFGLLAEIRWSTSMLKSQRGLCVSFSIHHLFVWSNLNFLHISQWITLTIYLCLLLYSLCIRLLWDWWFHLFHHITYICYFVVSYLFPLWYGWFLQRCFVLLLEGIMFLLRFPFLSQVQVFWCDILSISRLKHPLSCFSSHFCILVIAIW